MIVIVEKLLDICYRVAVVCTIVGMSTIAFALVAVVCGTARVATRKRKTFAGKTQSLGGISSSSVKDARLARLDKTVTNKTIKKKPTSTKAHDCNELRRRPAASPISQCHPSRNSLGRSEASLPEELKPRSLRHFFVDGATTFRAIPNLQHSDDATARLQRIAREFMPIIRKRGLNIRSVSEMCCCSNGLEYELGGDRRCVAAGKSIAGNDPDTVAGYNGKLTNTFGETEHVIHLRLRSPQDHERFMSFDEVVDTMAHELAHCVHEDHGPSFWDLMDAILDDRAKIIEELEKGGTQDLDPAAASKAQFGGFNVYESFSGRLGCTHRNPRN